MGDNPTAREQVLEGWRHLQAQRPLAAWGSWQRALRIEPSCRPASAALEQFAVAGPLPAAARRARPFRPPRGDARRARWDAALPKTALDLLTDSAAAFAALGEADPGDAEAHFNAGLCWAWIGRNVTAIAALDRCVQAADADFELAVEAWLLAEVLRQGGGAEHLADDLAHTLVLPWRSHRDPVAWLQALGVLQELPPLRDPVSGQPVGRDVRTFEWYDRPLPAARGDLTVADLPRLLAHVIIRPGLLQFSSPIPDRLRLVERVLRQALGDDKPPFDRRSTPLSFVLQDAAAWQFRLPSRLDEATRDRLQREALTEYFETDWIEQPRQALGRPPLCDSPWLSPKATAQVLRDAQLAGDTLRSAAARAKLEAVVRYREQLADRPHAAAFYAGFAFDSLRRKLGLDVEPVPNEGVA